MSRQVFPDALKAFLVCMVVVGHTIGLAYKGQMEDYWNNPLITIIYSFHIPLFISISGYFLGKSNIDIKSQIKKKIQRLGIPILSIGLIYMLVMLAYDYSNINSIKLLYNSLTFYWFFDCLLILSLFCIISEMKGERYGLIIQLTTLAVLFVVYPVLPSIFRKLQIVRLLPIFLMSLYIGKYSNVIVPLFSRYKRFVLMLSTFIWGIIIAFYGGGNLLEYSLYARIIVGIFSSLTVLCVFSYVYQFIPSKITEKGGKNCMGIYIIHAPIFLNLPRIDSPLLIMLITILLILTSSVITDMIRKTFLKQYILGEA